MPGTIYLHLLIICGIWFQGIIGTFADEENKGSWDFHARQKRVVSYEQGGARVASIEEKPYIVHIKKNNRVHCVGTILSHQVVLTTAQCAQSDAMEYKVLSKSGITNRGAIHNVTNIILHKGIPGRPMDGIALLTIHPAVVYGLFVRNIELHVGPLLPGMLGSVSGWGYNMRNKDVGPGTKYLINLREIEVPIIAHRVCVERYQTYYPITEKDICTFHPQRHCGHVDGGAPLVIDNSLVGIFLRSGPLGSLYNPAYPEVFALLQHSYYRDWIRAHI